MCHELTILARQDTARTIARCRHGTIHLNWDRATLRLQPAELVRIAQFLNAAIEWVGDEPACCGNHDHCLVYDEHGYFHLWLLGLGLYLNALSFSLLLDMLAKAVEAITRDDPARPQASSRLGGHPTGLFSAN